MNVGQARLTRGHPASRSPSAQLSPKRENLTFSQLNGML